MVTLRLSICIFSINKLVCHIWVIKLNYFYFLFSWGCNHFYNNILEKTLNFLLFINLLFHRFSNKTISFCLNIVLFLLLPSILLLS